MLQCNFNNIMSIPLLISKFLKFISTIAIRLLIHPRQISTSNKTLARGYVCLEGLQTTQIPSHKKIIFCIITHVLLMVSLHNFCKAFLLSTKSVYTLFHFQNGFVNEHHPNGLEPEFDYTTSLYTRMVSYNDV